MNNDIYIRRLQILREHLRENVTEETLFMRFWTCGTKACALSHACMIPEFQAHGLQLKIDVIDVPLYVDPDTDETACEYWAGEEFFGLTERQCLYLFSSLKYESENSVAEVIEHINEVIEELKNGSQESH